MGITRGSWWVLGVLAAAGCAGEQGSDRPQAVSQRAALVSFNSCEELETYIEDTAVAQMRRQLDATLDGRGWGFEGPPVADAVAPKTDATMAGGGPCRP